MAQEFIPNMSKKNKSEQKVSSYTGRTTIDKRERTGSFSLRAATGKILVENDGNCKKCGHHKYIESLSVYSPLYGQKKCTSCKALYVR